MTQFYHLSGAERLAVELAVELNKRGVQADILSMYNPGLPGVNDSMGSLLSKGIPNVYFLNMKIKPSFVSLIPAIFKLRRLIKKNKYDIIETSMLSPTVIASWATLVSRTRHVAGLHQVVRQDREKSIQHRFWKFTITCNRRIRLYAISNYVSNAWLLYSNTSPVNIRTIYNAISEDYFNAMQDRQRVRGELSLPSNCRIALYVGRLAKYKGCDTLLDALGPILEQNNLFLLYVGEADPTVEGSMEMIDQMKERIKNMGWGKWVHFVGYREDIPNLMASSDILVHYTRMEGFGLTLVEAMAVGLPVVASDAEGIPEVLEGTDSIMVSLDNIKGFRQAVLKILNRSFGENNIAMEKGLKRANNFTTNRRVDNMLAYFKEVCAERV